MVTQITRANMKALANYTAKINNELTALSDELYRLFKAADMPLFDHQGRDPNQLLDQAIESLEEAIEILNSK